MCSMEVTCLVSSQSAKQKAGTFAHSPFLVTRQKTEEDEWKFSQKSVMEEGISSVQVNIKS